VKIACSRCGKELGEILKGRLAKGLVYLCRGCDNRIKTAESAAALAHNGVPEFMQGIFGGNV